MNPEPPLGNKCGLLLFLYIAIGAIPELIKWLTLTYDTSLRGVLILAFTTALTTAITWRAYIDNGGNPPPPKPAAPVVKNEIADVPKK